MNIQENGRKVTFTVVEHLFIFIFLVQYSKYCQQNLFVSLSVIVLLDLKQMCNW